MGDCTVRAIFMNDERYMATFNAAMHTAALVESSVVRLLLVAIHSLAISGSSCNCWQRKIAAFLRAAILVSDRGYILFSWTTTLTSNILLFRSTSVGQKNKTRPQVPLSNNKMGESPKHTRLEGNPLIT